uniref:Uncharacterized protein n=1 Tax=Oryza rufipogon TaxID=4529 RepID=A0A0E0P6K0_ORYRU
MSCLMLNHEGFSKRTGSCQTAPGSQVVEMDQWVLADKRMHINNKWWRRIRRLVKSSLLQLCHCQS